MKKLTIIIFWILVLSLFTSCTKDEFELDIQEIPHTYQFDMVGRSYQDNNGYYHVTLDTIQNKQTLHRFGAYITNIDKWGLPAQVIWRCDAFWYTPDTLGHTYIEIGNVPTGESPWSWENFAITGYEGMTVPIVNGTSFADPMMDSIYCMMAPIGAMIGDTVEIFGKASFEEGDIILTDSINIIFK